MLSTANRGHVTHASLWLWREGPPGLGGARRHGPRDHSQAPVLQLSTGVTERCPLPSWDLSPSTDPEGCAGLLSPQSRTSLASEGGDPLKHSHHVWGCTFPHESNSVFPSFRSFPKLYGNESGFLARMWTNGCKSVHGSKFRMRRSEEGRYRGFVCLDQSSYLLLNSKYFKRSKSLFDMRTEYHSKSDYFFTNKNLTCKAYKSNTILKYKIKKKNLEACCIWLKNHRMILCSLSIPSHMKWRWTS